MEYRKLGSSGCVVSTLALGTMTFGAESSEEISHAQLDAYVAAGGNLIDIADVYAGTESEAIVGRWLAKHRDADVVLATKARFPTGQGVNDSGLSHRHLRKALDASLRRLGVDHIDLYQVHAWDPLTPLEETWRFLDDAVRRARSPTSASPTTPAGRSRRSATSRSSRGWSTPVTLQPQYNLLAREIEWEIVPACESTDLGMLPWSPLGGGWLTGKYTREERPAGETRLGENPERGVEAYDRRGSVQRTWDVVAAVESIAAERGNTMAQVALAWVADRPRVSSVILGARTLEQLEDNLGAAGLHLTPEEAARLDAASDPAPADYPYGAAGVEQRTRTLPG